MLLSQAITPYREPKNKMVSLYKNPGDHSTDNGLLFSATYIMLLTSEEQEQEREWFSGVVKSCEIVPGLYSRYPGDVSFNSHDDLTGVSVASSALSLRFSRDILLYGLETDFAWNTEKPGEWTWRSYLARVLGFVSFLRVSAGLPIGMLSQITSALSFVASTFEPKNETSGKCLLYLKALDMRGKYPIVDMGIEIWKRHVLKQYGGMRGVYEIYFGKDHPLTSYVKDL